MPVTTETHEGFPGGMNLALPPQSLTELEARYIQDGLVHVPGITKRRGPVSPIVGVATISNAASGIVQTLDPAGDLRIGVLNGAFFSVLSPDGTTRTDLTWPWTLPVSGIRHIVDTKEAITGGALIGTSSTYDFAGAVQGLALWRGGRHVDYSTGTVSVTRGSISLTGAGTTWLANVSPGMFVFANTDDPYTNVYIGVVKAVTANGAITLGAASPHTATAKAYTIKSLRGLNPRVVEGEITCATGSAVVNGGLTKFAKQGLATGTWQIHRASDFAFVGKVTSVASDIQLTLTANAAVAMLEERYVALRVDGNYDIDTTLNTRKLGFLTAAYAERQWYANLGQSPETTARLYFSDTSDPEAVDLSIFDGDYLNVVSSRGANTPIRALQSSYNSLLVLKENEVFSVLGNSPSSFEVRKLSDDGTLCGMSVQSYAGGVLWAGRDGIQYYDGVQVQNLTENKLGDYYKSLMRSFDPALYRLYSMVVRDHYFLFLESATPTIGVTKGTVSSTPSRFTICLKLGGQAPVLLTNVNLRGAITLPADSGENVWYVVNTGDDGVTYTDSFTVDSSAQYTNERAITGGVLKQVDSGTLPMTYDGDEYEDVQVQVKAKSTSANSNNSGSPGLRFKIGDGKYVWATYNNDKQSYSISGSTLTASTDVTTDATRISSKAGDHRDFPTLRRIMDWEVGTGAIANQWDATEFKTAGTLSDQLSVNTSFTDSGGKVWTPRTGTHLARARVRPGDANAGTGERMLFRNNDTADFIPDLEGRDDYFAFSHGWETNWQMPSVQNMFAEHHSSAGYGQAVIRYMLEPSRGADLFNVSTVTGPFANATDALASGPPTPIWYNLGPWQAGIWYDFKTRVRWSALGKGILQVWIRREGEPNFTLWVDAHDIYTMASIITPPSVGSVNWMRGNYRNVESFTNDVFMDGDRMAASFEELDYDYPIGLGGDSSFGVLGAEQNLMRNSNATTNTTGYGNSSNTTIARDTTTWGEPCTKVTLTASSFEMRIDTNTGLALAAGTAIDACLEMRCEPAAYVSIAGKHRIGNTDATNSDQVSNIGLILRSDRWRWMVLPAYVVQPAKTGDQIRLRITNNTASMPIGTNFYIKSVKIVAKGLATQTAIPTDGATVTRTAARLQAPSAVMTATQGFAAFRIAPYWSTDAMPGAGVGVTQLKAWRLDANNQLNAYFDEATKTWKVNRIGTGTSGTATAAATVHRVDEEITVVAAWTATEIKVSVNGAPFVTTAHSAIPAGMPATFDIGSITGATSHIEARFLWSVHGTGLLDDDDAEMFDELDTAGPDADFTMTAVAAPTAIFQYDTSAYLEFGAIPRLVLYYNDGASTAELAGATTSAPVLNTPYWIRVRAIGDTFTGEKFLTDPGAGGAVETSVSKTLTSGTVPTSAEMGVDRSGKALVISGNSVATHTADVDDLAILPMAESRICDASDLFDLTGNDTIACDGGTAGPDFYLESRKYDGGDGLRRKTWKYLALNYRAGGDSLKVDTVTGLNEIGRTSASEFTATVPTWDQTRVQFGTWNLYASTYPNWDAGINSQFRPKKVKFQKGTQHIAFRLYQKSAALTSAIIGPFQLGYKNKRAGRI